MGSGDERLEEISVTNDFHVDRRSFSSVDRVALGLNSIGVTTIADIREIYLVVVDPPLL